MLPMLLYIAGCSSHSPVASTPKASMEPTAFVEIAERDGINFHHENGSKGKKYMPETVGSGVAFLDYDNDGWQDILFVNGTHWPNDSGPAGTPHLYHNNRDGTFTDVTHEAGLDIEMYGMGVAVGDFDNDGFEDIYITCLGPNHLFRNTLGDHNRSAKHIFEDISAHAGLQGAAVSESSLGLKWKWSTGAAWLDYDRDGKLDLFVCNYVKWSPSTDIFCGNNGRKSYCSPSSYQGVACTLYHNEGSGRFKDVSKETGIISQSTIGKSFGISIADFNGDGWPDIAVSNDTWPNFLFINESGKHFKEFGAESGISLNESGKAKAGMGIDAADWMNNGTFGLGIGNFAGESLSLFENNGKASFADKSHQSGLASESLLFLTFGLFWFDYDLDGFQDLLTVNGHIDDFIQASNSMLAYRERPQLYRNLGNGVFKEIGVSAGLSEVLVGRGAAYGDIDNNGSLDVAMVSNGENGRLYRNNAGSGRNWIRFRLVGARSNRDGIGAIVRITSGGLTQSQLVHSGGSYLSECQRQPTFGLGKSTTVTSVEVKWPSGVIDRASALPGNRQYVVNESAGCIEDQRAAPPNKK